ncbi:hypothetical protein [Marivirga sp.]|uniref:hypothetical protein n=1 Tax=Marivirga sp. TaxID=2018662 RepID=UPI002D7F387C|nr:hypothetical protein [Marivirga sp.]HET8858587.1 hypothetical protein [Marivirga sp.]
MPTFTIVFNDDTSKIYKSKSKESLITEFNIADATAFQADVKEIRWEENNHSFIECISSGKISKTAHQLNEK